MLYIDIMMCTVRHINEQTRWHFLGRGFMQRKLQAQNSPPKQNEFPPENPFHNLFLY